MNCILCASSNTSSYLENFWRCHSCELIFKDNRLWLSAAEEKSRYMLHQNNADDPDYQQFFSILVEYIIENEKPGSKFLDFGSGNSSAVSKMLSENLFKGIMFDPYFFPNEIVFEMKFDFIVATEVIEHLRRPMNELMQIKACLNAGSRIYLMTEIFEGTEQEFKSWYYKNDPTHLAFYNPVSLNHFAKKLKAKLSFIDQKRNFCFEF